jgi:hypothetical protein
MPKLIKCDNCEALRSNEANGCPFCFFPPPGYRARCRNRDCGNILWSTTPEMETCLACGQPDPVYSFFRHTFVGRHAYGLFLGAVVLVPIVDFMVKYR